MTWQPIETAPKDASILLAVWNADRPYYCREVGWWEESDGGFWSIQVMGEPTHWMPLPPPPVTP